MFIRNLADCEEFVAGDGSFLRELLHGEKGDFPFRYSLAHAVVKSGKVTQAHKLKFSEVYYILEGKGLMYIDEEASDVWPGCAVYIPPRAKQYIKNTGDTDLKFLCIVDPAWQKESEEVLE